MTQKIKLKPTYLKYGNDKTDYKIYSAVVDNVSLSTLGLGFLEYEITIVGNMPPLILYKEYTAMVEAQKHPVYGINYLVSAIFSETLSTKEEEHNLLRCFVTDKQFENIVAVYELPITTIRADKFDCGKIKGFSANNLALLKGKIDENERFALAIIELSKFGLGFDIIKKCVNKYGSSENAIKLIKENPYRLYMDIDGIGWKRADEVAMALGIDAHALCRVEAAIFFCIDDNSDGSTWFDLAEILDKAESLLGYEFGDESYFINILENNSLFYTDGALCALERNRLCEHEIAQKLKDMIASPTWAITSESSLNMIVAENERKLGIKYTEKQRSVFTTFNSSNVMVMTGYAGTGKSQSLCGLLDILDYAKISYKLCAPTGKAAQQIERYTKRNATTVHRMLGLRGDSQGDDVQPERLFTEVLIIDEFSMTDIFLFRSILRSLSNRTKLLLVGDPVQLSAVGLGNCLKDMIESEAVPTVQLTEVFRQALDNGSLQLATAIRQGEIIFDSTLAINSFGVKKDCVLWSSNKNETVQNIVALYKKLLGTYAIEDIVAISPVKKNGCTSVHYLNELLQQACNPPDDNKVEIETVRCKFRVGDKVIHIRNNYEAEWLDDNYNSKDGNGVFNGTLGKIVVIDEQDEILYVKYDGFIIAYTKDMLGELELSYAITTHKMQGSSTKVVIYVINSNSYMLNNRNNIYTALTRTTDKSYILAEYSALTSGIKKEESKNRNTFLLEYLNLLR